MIDIEQPDQLLDYLRRTGRVGADERVMISPLSGGVSNRTVLVTRPTGEAWVMKQALAKLRVQADWFADPARIHREALGIHWLAQLCPRGTIPPLIFEDEAAHLLAMQAIPQPHANWKAMLLAGEIDLNHVRQFARLLARIHAGSAQATSLQLAEVFGDRSFFETLRLEPYYQFAATNLPQAAQFLDAVVADTRTRRVCLVHGDYSPKNVLVHNGRLVLLDHEVIHWGDPGFDLGFALTHLLSKARHLPEHRARLSEAINLFVIAYHETVGRAFWREHAERPAISHTIACQLARVAGRSPLEYLAADERAAQQAWVLETIRRVPDTLEELIDSYFQGLTAHAAH